MTAPIRTTESLGLMPDPAYDEARALAAQLGEGLSQSALQRRLSIGYRQARQIMNQLETEGHIGPRDHECQALLTSALSAYSQALAGCARYENREDYPATSGLGLHGWSCHSDAAQVARDALEAAVLYGATPDQLQAAARTSGR
ncbi:DNA translocase FtsK [Streptomyces atratus]|uniref:DNA translocase FtsK n=1 Tax=Streptomyces atratus TaxID=1893 RepID=UPI0022556A80|nr:DNA translocase FtsK [Streptomyces atratus]MCX5345883.1 hypothetical protein [Streptomyces atratus]